MVQTPKIKKPARRMATFALILLGMTSTFSQGNAQTRERSQELLRQAREALGGQARLGSVQALAVSANFRRKTGELDLSGQIKLEFLLPDKFMRSETTNLPGNIGQITSAMVLNGRQAWTDFRSSSSEVPLVRSASGDPQREAELQTRLRSEYLRYLIAWLLTVPSSIRVDFDYAGEAQAQDGRAQVLDVKGGDGFVVRLFLDDKTHRPLMLSYRAPAPRQFNIGVGRTGNIIKGKGQTPGSGDIDVQVHFSDYRSVDGILLPYRLTKTVNGTVEEELNIVKFKINPALKAGQFQKK
jgi:hypothetical protein